jgi:hypothetical protein
VVVELGDEMRLVLEGLAGLFRDLSQGELETLGEAAAIVEREIACPPSA